MMNSCPNCGGKKGYYARTCQRCAPPRLGLPGIKGPNHPAWKGGFREDRDGYIKTYAPDHPWPRKGGYVYEHARVMELHLGRRLSATETVHHIDHNRKNNALANLVIIKRGPHSRLHRLEDVHRRQRDALGRFA